MNKIEKMKQQIKELQEQLEEMEKHKVWLPYERFWDDVEGECKRVGWCNKYLPKLNEQEKLELKLYLAQRAWKKEFDDVELDWEDVDITKYYIYYDNRDNKYYIGIRYYTKYNMQVYFSTREKAEQCLQWLRDSGVIV